MIFHLLTIFPQIFDSYINESIIKRAQKDGIIDIKVHDLRDWTTDKHRSVDDTPYGGGAGMVMKVDVLYRALEALKSEIRNSCPEPSRRAKSETNSKSKIIKNTRHSTLDTRNSKIVLLSAKGKTWNQQLAKKYAKLDSVVLVCGRYEGVDERIKKYVDEEISIGDYVLTGGEIGALAIVDSVTRLLPGALGNAESAADESHSIPGQLEYPQYTRPEVFIDDAGKKSRVPKVLLSGNHAEIAKWREDKKKQKYKF